MASIPITYAELLTFSQLSAYLSYQSCHFYSSPMSETVVRASLSEIDFKLSTFLTSSTSRICQKSYATICERTRQEEIFYPIKRPMSKDTRDTERCHIKEYSLSDSHIL